MRDQDEASLYLDLGRARDGGQSQAGQGCAQVGVSVEQGASICWVGGNKKKREVGYKIMCTAGQARLPLILW